MAITVSEKNIEWDKDYKSNDQQLSDQIYSNNPGNKEFFNPSRRAFPWRTLVKGNLITSIFKNTMGYDDSRATLFKEIDLIKVYNENMKSDVNRLIVNELTQFFNANEKSIEFWLMKYFCMLNGSIDHKLQSLRQLNLNHPLYNKLCKM